jgi:hemoglobin/transferrin/lactoferrin receptor protein
MDSRSTTGAVVAVGLFTLVSAPIAGLAQSKAPGEGTPVLAQTQTLDEVTVSATRTQRRITDTPATVTVIGAEDIERNFINDIRDVTRYEPNLSVRRAPARFGLAGASTGRDGFSSFNIRGLEGNRVRILVDGVRVPNAYSFGATAIGRGDYFDFGLIRRLEVLRGSASALYGSDGLAGVVSITTRDANDFLATREGPRNAYGAINLGYNNENNAWTAGVIAAARASDNIQVLAMTSRSGFSEIRNFGDNTSAGPLRTAPNPVDGERQSGLFKLNFGTGGYRGRFTAEVIDTRSNTDVLSSRGAPPLTATSVLRLTANDTISRERYSLENRFDIGSWWADDVLATIYTQDASTRQVAFEDRNVAADRTRDTTYKESIQGLFVQATKRTGIQRWTYGLDLDQTKFSNFVTGLVPPAGETFPLRRFPITDYTTQGLFVQNELDFGAFSIIPAARYDSYKLQPVADSLFPVPSVTKSGSAITPKLGVVWRLTPQASLYGNIADGFKAPVPQQVNQFFENVTSFYRTIPNPNLKPERSTSYEVGARWTQPGLLAQVALFEGKFKDFIEDNVQVAGAGTSVNPTVFQSINRGRVRISGFEARVRYDLNAQWRVQAAYGQTKGTDEVSGLPLNSVDPAKLVVGVSYLQPSWAVTANLTHVAEKKLSSINPTSITPVAAPFAPGAFTNLDLLASWQATKRLSLRAGVFNLLDEKGFFWSDVRGLAASSPVINAYSQPRRSASIAMRYEIY